jgi:Nif-specific regulatory protein
MSQNSPPETRADLELAMLYRISQAMAHQHDVAALLNEVLDILETEMGLSRGTLTLRQPGTDILVIEASRGLSEDERERGLYHLGEGITGKVAETGKPMLVRDISQSEDFLNRTGTQRRADIAFLCVPAP